MPEDVITAPSAEQTQAESSPAPVDHQEALNKLTSSERLEWQKTGKFPEPKKAESATASEPENGKSAAAPEAASQEKPPKRDNAESRLKELLADLKTAGLTPAELKNFKKEAQKVTPQAESAPAKAPEVKVQPEQMLQAPKKPELKDFEKWEDYEAAKDKFYEELAEFKAKSSLQEAEQKRVQAEQHAKLSKELAEGRKRYENFDQITTPLVKALTEDQSVNQTVTALIGVSPVFVDLLYTIGGDPADLADFLNDARTNPVQAVRKVVLLEDFIMKELKSKGDKEKVIAPEKKVTNAPNPPSEVSASKTTPPDDVESALKEGNFTRYYNAMNSRELAKRKAN